MPASTARHPTIEESTERGRAARSVAPRGSHAAWEPGPDRPDPVDLLEDQARSRVPELVPIRYGRMLASTFAFFRGAASVMAADLAVTPSSGITVQLCGDAHVGNFGVFAAPDRRLVFDINDFDETLPGPWEWDVKRLAASLAVAARERGFGLATRRRIVESAGAAYRAAMRASAAMRNVDVWYERVEADAVLERLRDQATAKQVARTERNLDHARRKDSLAAFAKLTQQVAGEPRLASDPPLVVPVRDLMAGMEGEALIEALEDVLAAYRGTLREDLRHLLGSYRLVDLARKVVGVGSVGTRAWIALLLGRDERDPLFLQVKEAEASVLEPLAGRSRFHHHGRRVVEGQRLMQAATDIMLGWVRATGIDGGTRDFYVRQLWDSKGSPAVDVMRPDALEYYGQLCGGRLAGAHARWGDRVAIAAYLGAGPKFERALAAFAERYADQNERDHAALSDAVRDGRVDAQSGI